MNPLRKINSFIASLIDGIGSLVLYGMFIVILVIGLSAVITGHRDLSETCDVTKMLVVETADIIKNAAMAQTSSDTTRLILRLDSLRQSVKCHSQSTLDSSTISFLFEIISLALVSAGVYLLSRAKRALRKSEERIRVANSFFRGSVTSLVIESYLSAAQKSSGSLRSQFDGNLLF